MHSSMASILQVKSFPFPNQRAHYSYIFLTNCEKLLVSSFECLVLSHLLSIGQSYEVLKGLAKCATGAGFNYNSAGYKEINQQKILAFYTSFLNGDCFGDVRGTKCNRNSIFTRDCISS